MALLEAPEIKVLELSSFSDYILLLLTKLRNIETSNKDFRQYLNAYGRSCAYSILGLEPKTKKRITTGNRKDYVGTFLEDIDYILLPILRAGEPMCRGIEDVFREFDVPFTVRQLGIKRKEEGFTLRMVDGQPTWDFEYHFTYANIPETVSGNVVIPVDVMVASGGSLELTTRAILRKGVPRRIYYASALSALYGKNRVLSTVRELRLQERCRVVYITGEIDRGGIEGQGLDERGYITPGLGDAGDRSHDSDKQRNNVSLGTGLVP